MLTVTPRIANCQQKLSCKSNQQKHYSGECFRWFIQAWHISCFPCTSYKASYTAWTAVNTSLVLAAQCRINFSLEERTDASDSVYVCIYTHTRVRAHTHTHTHLCSSDLANNHLKAVQIYTNKSKQQQKKNKGLLWDKLFCFQPFSCWHILFPSGISKQK